MRRPITTAAPGSPAIEGRESKAGGFTLVELLISLTLLGLLSLAVFGGFRFGVQSWHASLSSATRTDQVLLAQGFLRQRLSDQFASSGSGPGPAAGTGGGLSGTENTLAFTGSWLGPLGLAGLYNFEIKVEQKNEEQNLTVSWRLAALEANEGPDPDNGLTGERNLISGISGARFRYFGALGRTGEPDWNEHWVGENGLPLLISLDVSFPPGSGRIWPELIVAPVPWPAAKKVDQSHTFAPGQEPSR